MAMVASLIGLPFPSVTRRTAVEMEPVGLSIMSIFPRVEFWPVLLEFAVMVHSVLSRAAGAVYCVV